MENGFNPYMGQGEQGNDISGAYCSQKIFGDTFSHGRPFLEGFIDTETVEHQSTDNHKSRECEVQVREMNVGGVGFCLVPCGVEAVIPKSLF